MGLGVVIFPEMFERSRTHCENQDNSSFLLEKKKHQAAGETVGGVQEAAASPEYLNMGEI